MSCEPISETTTGALFIAAIGGAAPQRPHWPNSVHRPKSHVALRTAELWDMLHAY